MKIQLSESMRRHGVSLISAVVILGGVGAWGHYRFGSIRRAVAYLAGDRLFFDASSKPLGPVEPGQKGTVEFLLTNYSDDPVVILGAKASCSCSVPQNLPAAVAPGATQPLVISVSPNANSGSGAPGEIALIQFHTDHKRQSSLVVRITGEKTTGADTRTALPGG